MRIARFYRVTDNRGATEVRSSWSTMGTCHSPGPDAPACTRSGAPARTARDEILDAAGELFTTLGYAGTSTRTIADSVGIRQASLYHYFKTKDDILCTLLGQTVAPTLSFIPSLLGAEPALTAAEHLHALAAFDGDQLLGGQWNLGALYLLARACATPGWSRSGRTASGCGCTISRSAGRSSNRPASTRRPPTCRSASSSRW